MKKLLSILFVLSTISPALAYAPPLEAITQVHDMQMIKEQQFRRDELNYYNDVKEEKARYQKKVQKTTTAKPESVIIKAEPSLIQDSGEIKIKYNGN
jgi:hypothetical protein